MLSEDQQIRIDSAIVLWSTQSGRSKACAQRCSRMLSHRGIRVLGKRFADGTAHLEESDYHEEESSKSEFTLLNLGGCPFDDYGAENFLRIPVLLGGGKLDNKKGQHILPPLLVMFVSTTGDAEHCDSIRECWKSL